LFAEDKVGAFASPALVGNIGQQIAGKFRLFFDYSRQRIIFDQTILSMKASTARLGDFL